MILILVSFSTYLLIGIEENKAISNYDFNELLTCSDEEFDDKTNSMKSVVSKYDTIGWYPQFISIFGSI